MAKLEALLEQRGVASPREVSEAVARSQLHGGDVTTSLLQFSSIDEAALSAALSECYGLPAASVGALPAPEDLAAVPLPRELAERYCCFPLASPPGELVLAVARPLEPGLKEELGFALGVQLSERVALEVRIRQAISSCYGAPLAERDQQAIARLDGNVDGAAEKPAHGAWSDTQLSALPRPPSEPPPPVEERQQDWPSEWGSRVLPPVAPRPQPAQAASPRARRRGPFTLAMAREELARASTRNQVLDAFFSFACQFFEYSALFAVHSSIAEGLNSAGPGTGPEEIQAVGVPLDLPSSLSEAAESCNVRITRLGRDGIDQTLALDLKRQLSTRVLILPVCLRGRCAVLLYGDNGGSDVLEREVGDVVALSPDVAAALGRIILQRKRDAARRAPGEGAEISEPLLLQARPPEAMLPEQEPAAAEAEQLDPDFALPTLPSKNRDRSRSNGRGRSSFPPAVAASPRQGVLPFDPAGAAAASPATHVVAPGPAPELENGAPEPDLVEPAAQQEAAEPPRPDALITKVTRPARTIGLQPRLPSVIVDKSATEETPWTRAAAATQPPQAAKKAGATRPAARVVDPQEAATVRPNSRRQAPAPAPAPRLEIREKAPAASAPDTAVTDPAPPHPALAEAAPPHPAHAEAALTDPAPPPAEPLEPGPQLVAPLAAAPLAAAPLAAAVSSPVAAAPAAPATQTEPPRPDAARSVSPADAPEGAASPEPVSPALPRPAEVFGAPIKPFEQRPITAPPLRRKSTQPLPPFDKDRTSAPPLPPRERPSSPPLPSPERPSSPPSPARERPSAPPSPARERPSAPPFFAKDRPSSPPGGRNISIARPDSPSVRPVPRVPTVRPPDMVRSAPLPATGSTTSAGAGVASPGADNPAPQAPAPEAAPAAEPSAERSSVNPPPPAERSSINPPPPAERPSANPPPPASVRGAPASERPGRITLPPSSPPGEPEIEALIDQLVQGNPRAVQDLTRIGAPTVGQLMARFPGPVVSERAGPSSRASECGPLLQALASIGSPALPDITRSTEDRDARVRRWATLLLGEMPGPEACRAVVQRLADDVPRVHQAALDAARLLLSSSAANLFRKTLFEVAEAEDAPLTLRLRTLEHVARLRDSASVPRLIAFLALDTEPVVHKALWALSVITRQDFGRDAQSWNDWWQSHQAKHRLQWLIEALDHRDPRLRKAAADELLIEVKDSFGYSEDLPQEGRLEAQRRYQEWWETTGARRFGRLQ